MKRQLSSKQTFLLKIILPIFLSTTLIGVSLTLFFNFPASEFFPVMILFPAIALVGIISMYLTVMRYKKVSVDHEFLYVSNYLKEITIPFLNISAVTEIKWVRTRPITIHLKTDSEFGQKIVFMPRIFEANPIVAELKALVKIRSI